MRVKNFRSYFISRVLRMGKHLLANISTLQNERHKQRISKWNAEYFSLGR